MLHRVLFIIFDLLLYVYYSHTNQTGAWITTPGCNEGLYRMVGKARREYADVRGKFTRSDIKLVGIYPLRNQVVSQNKEFQLSSSRWSKSSPTRLFTSQPDASSGLVNKTFPTYPRPSNKSVGIVPSKSVV